MNFEKTEKKAIVKVLEKIIMADGEFHQKEQLFLLALLKEFNMSISEAKEGTENIDLETALFVLSNMSKEKKEYVKEKATFVSIIDGEMHPNEIALLMPLFNILS